MAWDGIKGIFSGIWEIIKSVFTLILDQMLRTLGGVLASIKAVWESIWNNIKAFASALGGRLKT